MAVFLTLCEWVSSRICRLLTGQPMTLCAYSWWRKDKRAWRRIGRVLDWLFAWAEPQHTRRSYERRFPK